jgi:hypothetical protein
LGSQRAFFHRVTISVPVQTRQLTWSWGKFRALTAPTLDILTPAVQDDCGEAEKGDRGDCSSGDFHGSAFQDNLFTLTCAGIQRFPRDWQLA